jgi:hypothetical protein
VRGGERDAKARAEEDNEHRAELDRKAARGRDLGELEAEGKDDLVAEHAEAEHDAKATDRKDPERQREWEEKRRVHRRWRA